MPALPTIVAQTTNKRVIRLPQANKCIVTSEIGTLKTICALFVYIERPHEDPFA
jgi:hypothetical protein